MSNHICNFFFWIDTLWMLYFHYISILGCFFSVWNLHFLYFCYLQGLLEASWLVSQSFSTPVHFQLFVSGKLQLLLVSNVLLFYSRQKKKKKTLKRKKVIKKELFGKNFDKLFMHFRQAEKQPPKYNVCFLFINLIQIHKDLSLTYKIQYYHKIYNRRDIKGCISDDYVDGKHL